MHNIQYSFMKPIWFMIVIAAIFVSGCATTPSAPMALSNIVNGIEAQSQPIVLFTLKTTNEYKPKTEPDAKIVFVENTESELKDNVTGFRLDKPYKSTENGSNEYLVSMHLSPGKHIIKQIRGYKMGGFEYYFFYYNPDYELNIKPDTIAYLGHVDMVNKKRTSDDQCASGPLTPLIDQAIAGFSKGYFDVTVFDRYEEDLAIFRDKYPVLNDRKVIKDIFKASEVNCKEKQ